MTDKTTDELRQIQTTLHSRMKALKVEKRTVDAELQRRAIAWSAAGKLAQMSPDERAAVGQLIGQAGAIASRAAVGTPGT